MQEALKLLAVFIIILCLLRLTRALAIALAGGILGSAVLFGLGLWDTLAAAAGAAVDSMTLTVVAAFYSITFLQRMLEKRGDLRLAQQSLSGIFNNRRINAALTPILIGMLPSAGAVTIAGAILDETVEEYLTVDEKTFVTSYFRHIPESIFPTYPSIIIGLQLTGVSVGAFMLFTLPMVGVLMLLGYLFYLRKLPVDTGMTPDGNRRRNAWNLVRSLWTIAASIVLVLALNLPVWLAVACVIALNVFVGRFAWREIGPMFVSAFEVKLILATVLAMVFKDVIIASGAMKALPALFEQLPIPQFLVFFLLFVCGTLLAGQQAISVIALPLAFATIPGAGTALFVLLMAGGYLAMQVSPTHICLAIVTQYFDVSLGALVKKTLPVIVPSTVVLIGYYLLLDALL